MSAGLASAQRPIQHILYAPETEDLAIQEPGVGWWLKHGAWHRVELPEMTYQRLHGLSVMAASQTGDSITSRSPILSADLPGGLRLQSVMPPAVPAGTMALSFRRGDERLDEIEDVPRLYNTSRWNRWAQRHERRAAEDGELLAAYDRDDIEGFLRLLATTKQTGLVCGSTGAGKSRLSKLLGGAIPLHERIITVEDAKELVVRQPNCVRHLYSASGNAGASPIALMKATLRERPDRVLLGEMRDAEAAAMFIDEVSAGHPGSMSTIHGKNPADAARRLFNMFKASPAGTGMQDDTVVATLGAAIDFILPVENDKGKRTLAEVWLAADARRRGETFKDLLASP